MVVDGSGTMHASHTLYLHSNLTYWYQGQGGTRFSKCRVKCRGTLHWYHPVTQYIVPLRSTLHFWFPSLNPEPLVRASLWPGRTTSCGCWGWRR